MRIKEITLVGFKSFAKKSTLSFQTPITAIVGPNGSGKSNIVEAIRFVLGEQSMKSMRGKAGADLIFSGSQQAGSMSRAAVHVVFDNHDRVFSIDTEQKVINVDFDEIEVSREVYKDGSNTYKINGAEVRLKDVVQLLASVNIGTSGHHIISQGEADRILNASPRERREMIEDALGLRVYQYKIKESEKKLEKTTQNIADVQSRRREIAPHIKFLKRQVEKIEKAQEVRSELEHKYTDYLYHEQQFLHTEEQAVTQERTRLKDELAEAQEKLQAAGDTLKQYTEEKRDDEEIAAWERDIAENQKQQGQVSREIGKIEGVLEYQESETTQPQNHITLTYSQAQEVYNCLHVIQQTITDNGSVADHLPQLNEQIKTLKQALADGDTGRTVSVPQRDLPSLQEKKQELLDHLASLQKQEQELQKQVHAAREKTSAVAEEKYAAEKKRHQAQSRVNELQSAEQMLRMRESQLNQAQESFENELQEGSVLIGSRIFDYRSYEPQTDEQISRSVQEEKRRAIEKLKIRLEDLGGGARDEDVIREYEETKERDAFLVDELADLEQSMQSLEALISDLKKQLHTEFATGLTKINEQFQSYFSVMFGGGRAYLSLVTIARKKTDEYTDDDEEPVQKGIDITVTLPNKKAKGLTVLSGGERSLTSIALLFAISQVNPPPFLVLDETDAALDEANSRRYGNMLENLAQYSQLIIVTHNRETMSRAHMLYGITIGKDSASKLLSIQLEEAVSIAKQ